MDIEKSIESLQKRVTTIELRLKPRDSRSDLLYMHDLIELLVDMFPPEIIDAILAKTWNEENGWCNFCYKDEGHGPCCPVELFRLVRERKGMKNE